MKTGLGQFCKLRDHKHVGLVFHHYYHYYNAYHKF